MKSIFEEIRIDYTDENGVLHIDGYKTGDDNEEGVGIGYFVNGEVYWKDTKYQFDPYVEEIVNELKALFNEENPPVLFDKVKPLILNNIDYKALRKQKAILINMIQDWGEATDKPQREDAKEAEGLLNLIDTIQDNAVDNLGIPEKVVFDFKTYRVFAEATTRCYTDIEALSREKALEIAEGMDGGDFTTDEDGGVWNIIKKTLN